MSLSLALFFFPFLSFCVLVSNKCLRGVARDNDTTVSVVPPASRGPRNSCGGPPRSGPKHRRLSRMCPLRSPYPYRPSLRSPFISLFFPRPSDKVRESEAPCRATQETVSLCCYSYDTHTLPSRSVLSSFFAS